MSLDISKYNVGSTDRIIRGVIGLLLVIGAFRGGSLFVGGIGAILIATAYLRYCPAYALFKLSSVSDTITPEGAQAPAHEAPKAYTPEAK